MEEVVFEAAEFVHTRSSEDSTSFRRWSKLDAAEQARKAAAQPRNGQKTKEISLEETVSSGLKTPEPVSQISVFAVIKAIREKRREFEREEAA